MHKRVSANESSQLLREEGYVYVDVRTEEEYGAAHPEGAYNLPLLFARPEGRVPNPDFIAAFQAAFPPGSKVVVGCAGGGRGKAAAEQLEAAGREGIVECRPGFGGARDASGQVVEEGWRATGLPVETGQPEGRSWQSLKQKIGR